MEQLTSLDQDSDEQELVPPEVETAQHTIEAESFDTTTINVNHAAIEAVKETDPYLYHQVSPTPPGSPINEVEKKVREDTIESSFAAIRTTQELREHDKKQAHAYINNEISFEQYTKALNCDYLII